MWSIIAVGAPGFEDLTKAERMEQADPDVPGGRLSCVCIWEKVSQKAGLWSQRRFCRVSLYCSDVCDTDVEGHRIVGRCTLKAGPGTWGHRRVCV